MADLRHYLAASPRRLLLAIGRASSLTLPWEAKKDELVNFLVRALADPGHIGRLVQELPEAERAVLAALLAAGGRVEARHLTRRYGDLRPFRPWQAGAPQKPWLEPVSPVEWLWYLGLLFPDRESGEIAIPDDLLPYLPAFRLPEAEAARPRPAAAKPNAADLLCHDLALLLALLRRQPVRSQHGRWLPPRFLAAWGRACLVPPQHPLARSELQTGRRRFFHYLAHSAGLIETGALAPSPAAWLWLNAARSGRLHTLWQAWTAPDPEAWSIFRLPGADWLGHPQALLDPLHHGLASFDPLPPPRFSQVLLDARPGLLDLVPAPVEDPVTLLDETIGQLLAGPLAWLGLVEPGQTPETAVQVTPLGAAWLAGRTPDEGPEYARFALAPDIQPDSLRSSLRLILNAGLPDPAGLAVAVELGEMPVEAAGTGKIEDAAVPDAPADPGPRYTVTITAAGFARALHRDWSAPALLDALNRLADRPLAGAEVALLRAWTEAAGKTTLRPAFLLETTDPEVLARLASTRRGRPLIHRTLSPRAAIVDPARLNQIVRRLEEQEGVPPQVVASGEWGREAESTEYGPVSPYSTRSVHTPYSLCLALEVYRRLSQFIRLPVRLPQVLLDEVAAALTPAGSAAVEVAAGQVIAALQDAIDGRAPFPAWPEQGLPPEETLAVIKSALAAGQALQIDYYTAGRDELTRRRVEPYRIETRGDIPYLVGFCHRAQSERIFRVDRINSIVKVPLEGSEAG